MPEYLVDVNKTYKVIADDAEKAWQQVNFYPEGLDVEFYQVEEPELVVGDLINALGKSLNEVWDTRTFWGKAWGYNTKERVQREDFHWAKFSAQCQKIDDDYPLPEPRRTFDPMAARFGPFRFGMGT